MIESPEMILFAGADIFKTAESRMVILYGMEFPASSGSESRACAHRAPQRGRGVE